MTGRHLTVMPTKGTHDKDGGGLTASSDSTPLCNLFATEAAHQLPSSQSSLAMTIHHILFVLCELPCQNM